VAGAAGIDANQLAARAVNSITIRTSNQLTPAELRRWLIAHGFAELDDHGRLKPTPAGVQVGAGLSPLQGA
jgi:hypothetical protein